ncbi:MAG: hypothetical protein MHM6MM_002148 [Cercozoa sp. M6MM]
MPPRVDSFLDAVSNIYFQPPTLLRPLLNPSNNRRKTGEDVVPVSERAPAVQTPRDAVHAPTYSETDLLQSPLRARSPLDEWTPLEVARFESGLCAHGKQFHLVSQVVGTKSTAECVEFFYVWKQSAHYHMWRAHEQPTQPLPGDQLSLWRRAQEMLRQVEREYDAARAAQQLKRKEKAARQAALADRIRDEEEEGRADRAAAQPDESADKSTAETKASSNEDAGVAARQLLVSMAQAAAQAHEEEVCSLAAQAAESKSQEVPQPNLKQEPKSESELESKPEPEHKPEHERKQELKQEPTPEREQQQQELKQEQAHEQTQEQLQAESVAAIALTVPAVDVKVTAGAVNASPPQEKLLEQTQPSSQQQQQLPERKQPEQPDEHLDAQSPAQAAANSTVGSSVASTDPLASLPAPPQL